MSATNRTTYYNLPVFIGTDTPSWLGDWNNTMNAIDTAINGAHTEAQSAANTANSASSKSDANTESIGAMNKEIQTIKQAVQNYDSILDFNPKPIVRVANNTTSGSAAYLVQNTNKTLNRLWFVVGTPASFSNPITYNYTNESSGVNTWLDLFTVEDNCFNLNQTSLPNATNCLTLGGAYLMNVGESTNNSVEFAYVRTWFDGATTHIGITVSNAVTTYVTTNVLFNTAVFLSGSVYNPDAPSV